MTDTAGGYTENFYKFTVAAPPPTASPGTPTSTPIGILAFNLLK